jgi:hypothetical protein
MCCCGCAMVVLEPGAGFGSWRALFGFVGGRKKTSSMKAEDVMTEHVISVAPHEALGETSDFQKSNSDSIEPTVIEHG